MDPPRPSEAGLIASTTMQTYTPSGGLSPASGLFASLLPAIAPKSFRAALGDQIERMIDMLDALDGDTDLEETGDLEPSLGAYTRGYDLELDTSDDEPSLGSLGGTAASFFGIGSFSTRPMPEWAGGGRSDAELDDCDLEDGDDAEDDPAERGIGDQDGLEEQTGLFDRSGDELGAGTFSRSANRQLLADIGREARELAARLAGPLSPHAAYLRSIDGWEIVR